MPHCLQWLVMELELVGGAGEVGVGDLLHQSQQAGHRVALCRQERERALSTNTTSDNHTTSDLYRHDTMITCREAHVRLGGGDRDGVQATISSSDVEIEW